MTTETVVPFVLRGGNRQAYDCRAREILVEGPAGTGKTRTILELLNNLAHSFPGLRAVIVRKNQVTLTTTCLVTFNDKVLRKDLGEHVVFFGGSKSEPAAYRYDNGSTITVGGMDNPDKVLSSEYDIAYVNEATELTLEDWETLTTRVRPPGVLQYQRIIGDCNPSHDKHWLLARCLSGQTHRIRTRLTDNPAYFDDSGSPTADGARYLETLQGLTGTRRQRLLDGEWVGMEDAIYDSLERDKHLVSVPEGMAWAKSAIGVDYGVDHISAVVCVSEDTAGRVWARECWTGGMDEEPIVDMARSMRLRYNARVGVVDPIPAMQMLANRLSFTRSGQTTKGASGNSEGSRVRNVVRVKTLLSNDALRFDLDGEGVPDLFAEAQLYRWLHKDTENLEKYIVDRHNDDRVAAMEYAIEALKTGLELPTVRATPLYAARTMPPKRFGGRI